MAAADARILELQQSLQKCDADIALMERRIMAVDDDTQQVVAQMEAELEERMEQELERHDDQLEGDVQLTRHFAESYQRQTVEALLDKQVVGLAAEETALRAALMGVADEEFLRREREMVAEVEGVKARLLQLDADNHMASIQAAYIKHKECMGSIGAV